MDSFENQITQQQHNYNITQSDTPYDLRVNRDIMNMAIDSGKFITKETYGASEWGSNRHAAELLRNMGYDEADPRRHYLDIGMLNASDYIKSIYGNHKFTPENLDAKTARDLAVNLEMNEAEVRRNKEQDSDRPIGLSPEVAAELVQYAPIDMLKQLQDRANGEDSTLSGVLSQLQGLALNAANIGANVIDFATDNATNLSGGLENSIEVDKAKLKETILANNQPIAFNKQELEAILDNRRIANGETNPKGVFTMAASFIAGEEFNTEALNDASNWLNSIGIDARVTDNTIQYKDHEFDALTGEDGAWVDLYGKNREEEKSFLTQMYEGAKGDSAVLLATAIPGIGASMGFFGKTLANFVNFKRGIGYGLGSNAAFDAIMASMAATSEADLAGSKTPLQQGLTSGATEGLFSLAAIPAMEATFRLGKTAAYGVAIPVKTGLGVYTGAKAAVQGFKEGTSVAGKIGGAIKGATTQGPLGQAVRGTAEAVTRGMIGDTTWGQKILYSISNEGRAMRYLTEGQQAQSISNEIVGQHAANLADPRFINETAADLAKIRGEDTPSSNFDKTVMVAEATVSKQIAPKLHEARHDNRKVATNELKLFDTIRAAVNAMAQRVYKVSTISGLQANVIDSMTAIGRRKAELLKEIAGPYQQTFKRAKLVLDFGPHQSILKYTLGDHANAEIKKILSNNADLAVAIKNNTATFEDYLKIIDLLNEASKATKNEATKKSANKTIQNITDHLYKKLSDSYGLKQSQALQDYMGLVRAEQDIREAFKKSKFGQYLLGWNTNFSATKDELQKHFKTLLLDESNTKILDAMEILSGKNPLMKNADGTALIDPNTIIESIIMDTIANAFNKGVAGTQYVVTDVSSMLKFLKTFEDAGMLTSHQYKQMKHGLETAFALTQGLPMEMSIKELKRLGFGFESQNGIGSNVISRMRVSLATKAIKLFSMFTPSDANIAMKIANALVALNKQSPLKVNHTRTLDVLLGTIDEIKPPKKPRGRAARASSNVIDPDGPSSGGTNTNTNTDTKQKRKRKTKPNNDTEAEEQRKQDIADTIQDIVEDAVEMRELIQIVNDPNLSERERYIAAQAWIRKQDERYRAFLNNEFEALEYERSGREFQEWEDSLLASNKQAIETNTQDPVQQAIETNDPEAIMKANTLQKKLDLANNAETPAADTSVDTTNMAGMEAALAIQPERVKEQMAKTQLKIDDISAAERTRLDAESARQDNIKRQEFLAKAKAEIQAEKAARAKKTKKAKNNSGTDQMRQNVEEALDMPIMASQLQNPEARVALLNDLYSITMQTTIETGNPLALRQAVNEAVANYNASHPMRQIKPFTDDEFDKALSMKAAVNYDPAAEKTILDALAKKKQKRARATMNLVRANEIYDTVKISELRDKRKAIKKELAATERAIEKADKLKDGKAKAGVINRARDKQSTLNEDLAKLEAQIDEFKQAENLLNKIDQWREDLILAKKELAATKNPTAAQKAKVTKLQKKLDRIDKSSAEYKRQADEKFIKQATQRNKYNGAATGQAETAEDLAYRIETDERYMNDVDTQQLLAGYRAEKEAAKDIEEYTGDPLLTHKPTRANAYNTIKNLDATKIEEGDMPQSFKDILGRKYKMLTTLVKDANANKLDVDRLLAAGVYTRDELEEIADALDAIKAHHPNISSEDQIRLYIGSELGLFDGNTIARDLEILDAFRMSGKMTTGLETIGFTKDNPVSKLLLDNSFNWLPPEMLLQLGRIYQISPKYFDRYYRDGLTEIATYAKKANKLQTLRGDKTLSPRDREKIDTATSKLYDSLIGISNLLGGRAKLLAGDRESIARFDSDWADDFLSTANETRVNRPVANSLEQQQIKAEYDPDWQEDIPTPFDEVKVADDATDLVDLEEQAGLPGVAAADETLADTISKITTRSDRKAVPTKDNKTAMDAFITDLMDNDKLIKQTAKTKEKIYDALANKNYSTAETLKDQAIKQLDEIENTLLSQYPEEALAGKYGIKYTGKDAATGKEWSKPHPRVFDLHNDIIQARAQLEAINTKEYTPRDIAMTRAGKESRQLDSYESIRPEDMTDSTRGYEIGNAILDSRGGAIDKLPEDEQRDILEAIDSAIDMSDVSTLVKKYRGSKDLDADSNTTKNLGIKGMPVEGDMNVANAIEELTQAAISRVKGKNIEDIPLYAGGAKIIPEYKVDVDPTHKDARYNIYNLIKRATNDDMTPKEQAQTLMTLDNILTKKMPSEEDKSPSSHALRKDVQLAQTTLRGEVARRKVYDKADAEGVVEELGIAMPHEHYDGTVVDPMKAKELINQIASDTYQHKVSKTEAINRLNKISGAMDTIGDSVARKTSKLAKTVIDQLMDD